MKFIPFSLAAYPDTHTNGSWWSMMINTENQLPVGQYITYFEIQETLFYFFQDKRSAVGPFLTLQVLSLLCYKRETNYGGYFRESTSKEAGAGRIYPE